MYVSFWLKYVHFPFLSAFAFCLNFFFCHTFECPLIFQIIQVIECFLLSFVKENQKNFTVNLPNHELKGGHSAQTRGN